MDGIIVVNKQKGCTSHDVVNKVKKIVNKKVGHTGTLDPLATGVLPLLIGKGTLCSKYLINHDKVYEVSLKLGISTDTMDAEGKIIEEKEVSSDILTKENVEKVLSSFIGKQEQTPPIYSAIKVAGKKLYEYARKGQKVEIPKREIEIYNIKLVGINKVSNEIEFKVSCSKGTYIRSLCTDIAKALGTIGYMSGLERLQVGKFKIENSIKIDESTTKEYIEEHIIGIEELFVEKPKIEINQKKLLLFLNGVKLNTEFEDGVYKIYSENKFIGLGTVNKGLLKRDIIIL